MTKTENPDPALDTKQAAEYLSVSASFLEKDRCYRRSIRFLRIGASIRYRRSDLDAYLAQCAGDESGTSRNAR